MEMPKLPSCCSFFIATLLSFSVFPISHSTNLLSLSFQLHLQRPAPSPLNLHIPTSTQPLTPFLLSDHPLFHFDNSSQAQIVVGRACGLYLADPAASMELRHIYLTATLQRNEAAGGIASVEAEKKDEGGALVMMGNLASGAVSIVGGTREFAFATGQAKISMAPAGGSAGTLIISFDVEVRYEQDEAEDTFEE